MQDQTPTTNVPVESDFLTKLNDIWEHHLFTLNETSITVSDLIIALAVLLVGTFIAKRIARHVGGRVLPKLKIDHGAAKTIQSVLYYILLTVVVVTSMNIAGIPLTALTFFGGAIALGIGFGSQNVINNFISGLILLIERPIRVGDLVTIDGEIGTVIDIGARATKVESYYGSTYIVPNSTILENSVTNWNMPNSTIKTTVGVGVAYGSDTDRVRSLLEQAMNEHPLLVKGSDNQIMFTNFGDSSLDFEIHCRIKPKNTQEKIGFESDLRFRIDELFREHEIEIPFPQRDMHVKSGSI
jgi:potassium-dependent mechanosensitive channel